MYLVTVFDFFHLHELCDYPKLLSFSKLVNINQLYENATNVLSIFWMFMGTIYIFAIYE